MRFWRDHRWAAGRISEYLDGELAARSRMEHHLAECAECRRLAQGLRLVIDALHRLPAPRGGRGALQIAASVRVRLTE